MAPGNVVILNGTSSAGKTTIAAAVQDVMDEAYVHLGIDHFGLPERFNVRTEEAEPAAADGCLILFRDGRLVDVRLGPLGYRLRDGMYRAIAGLAEAGNHVVADDVIWDPRVLRSAVEALRHLPVLFVGVRCPLEVAERWERERGDRAPGGAATFDPRVHAHGVYDLEIDSSVLTPADCAGEIKRALESGRAGGAFRRLAEMLAQHSTW